MALERRQRWAVVRIAYADSGGSWVTETTHATAEVSMSRGKLTMPGAY